MRKLLLSLLFITAIFTSCSKQSAKCAKADSNITAPASEIASVQTYLNTNGIVATQHSSGLFYKTTAAGSGTIIANLCTTVTVNYTGKLTNGTVFDPASGTGTSTASFSLGNVIVGWQKGLPLIAKGGKITLYIPPSLGYGANAVGSIPPNSILIFDIELVDIAN